MVPKDDPTTRITNDQSVTRLRPQAAPYLVRDSKVPGLELRVAVDGTKTWSLRYRVNGERRRLKLGIYGPDRLTLSKAREQANRELRKVDGGTDPQAVRQAQREAAKRAKQDSIDALADDYITRHAKPTKRTWRADQGLLKNKIRPRWKGRPVSSITRRDCLELVQAIADKGAPIVANRVAALLSRLFRFAVDHEIITVNPAQHLPKPGTERAAKPEGESQPKPYDEDEIRAIWTATEALDKAPRAIYRLGLLTGQRPSEISDLEWRELDGSWWTIPGRRAKNGREHRVFLTPLALAQLKDVPRLDDEPHVFARYRGKRQLATINATVFAGVRRRQNPRHAMRDTVATGLAAAGVAIEDIAKVLNHTYGPRVTAGYNAYAYDREKRLAMGKWERRIRSILELAKAEQDEKVVAIAG
ncbi:MAG: tyrosine-type recombinase/integrase [Vicinamibacterales bacterium]